MWMPHRCQFYPLETVTNNVPVDMTEDGDTTVTTTTSFYCRSCLRVVRADEQEEPRTQVDLWDAITRQVFRLEAFAGAVANAYVTVRDTIKGKLIPDCDDDVVVGRGSFRPLNNDQPDPFFDRGL